ncbi:MAG TPA: translesion DNA synthesis-associated protein ImuA [Dyella sp.]|uniref:translesion DNA synthesis-associated protein ImuA n=1 Tax=Dyella sp. TaxID=1869338 RepID=UPI002F92D8D0
MGQLVAIDSLLDARRVWRGQPHARPPSQQPTGWAALDAALPTGGWPERALSELLLPLDGIGELRLLWPTLARLSHAHDAGMIALIAPPYLPFASAWAQAGVRMRQLQVVRAETRDVLWAAEQCLRSAACAAVVCWPQQADDRALRRLHLAAETGQCLGFALRPSNAAANPSPAALRIAIDTQPAQLRVLKCRGGNPPTAPIPFAG